MKNKITTIIWWESCITEHQIHTLFELSKLPNVQLIVYSESLIDSTREEQGWNECDWSLINIQLIKSYKSALKKLWTNKNSVHIFGGPFDNLRISLVLLLSNVMRFKAYILTEPYINLAANLHFDDKGKFKNWIYNKIRPLKYRIYWTLLRKRVHGIFAVSELAINQLKEFGVASNKILPFGYFIPTTNKNYIKKYNKNIDVADELRLIFVGTMNYRKGIDLAINAVNELNSIGLNIFLDAYGPANNINNYKWSKSVKYKGRIKFGQVESKISEYDMLILPSRFDGWGVVVNESIQAKVPVICSNHAGSSCIIKKWGCGTCYDGWSKNALKNSIKEIYKHKEKKLKKFNKMNNEACKSLLPKNGARFILHSILSNKNEVVFSNDWYI